MSSCQAVSQAKLAMARWGPHAGYFGSQKIAAIRAISAMQFDEQRPRKRNLATVAPRPDGQNREQLHLNVARLDHVYWRAFTRASVALHKASFAGRA